MVLVAAIDLEAVAEEMGVTTAGQRFFFKKSSLRLAFLLRVDGLAFFFFLLSMAKGPSVECSWWWQKCCHKHF